MSNNSYKAAILDLDGVITQTARLHAKAWKQMFDNYLQQRSPNNSENYQPFDIDTDYRKYVDGKPRYDGVESFLTSRGINLPKGDPDDSPETETICGLGNRKNQLFLQIMDREGVDIYQDTISQVRHWREQGIKTAVISSSRNCGNILKAAELTHLFDVKIDGVDSKELNLEGKPAPDIFLEAARQLDVEPKRAIVIEDAVAGVQAGRAGNFGLVVGVDREGGNGSMTEHGADVVIQDLGELEDIFSPQKQHSASPAGSSLPSALQQFDAIAKQLSNRHPALFIDYDGTLTPIVERPEDALLSDEMRSLLTQLAERFPVAIISGRDLADVREMVSLDNLHYAGSHGFDILSADGTHQQQEKAKSTLPELDEAEDKLRDRLNSIEGVHIERKRFAIAIHYRQATESAAKQIEQIVNSILEEHPQLSKQKGKKIFELKPNISWDKGKAVFWLLDKLNLNKPDVIPVYIGDDTTDEDAIHALHDRDKGIGIRVGLPDEPTKADYILRDPDEVKQFFQALCSTE